MYNHFSLPCNKHQRSLPTLYGNSFGFNKFTGNHDRVILHRRGFLPTRNKLKISSLQLKINRFGGKLIAVPLYLVTKLLK
jgi:hypothetical protein